MNVRMTIILSDITNMLFDLCPVSEIVLLKYKELPLKGPRKELFVGNI